MNRHVLFVTNCDRGARSKMNRAGYDRDGMIPWEVVLG